MGRSRRNSYALVYFARPVGSLGPVKIGCSVYPKNRIAQLAAWSPIDLEIVATTPGDEFVEAQFHRLFLDSHRRLEWFDWTPELGAVIAAINAGTFDPASLPSYAGILKGMRARLAGYCDLDWEYLLAFKEYSRRDYRSSGWHRGHLPHPTVFAAIRDHDQKRRILAGLSEFLSPEQAAA